MFGLLRLPFLLIIAFVAGVFFERNRSNDACLDTGGRWSDIGICVAE